MRSASIPQLCPPPLQPGRSAPATLLEGFARHVTATPERCALSYAGVRISYLELDRWSSRLARWIAATVDLSGVHEPLIPFALAQHPGRVAVLLAILKLGGAYVPIEPTYPAARIRRMLDDIGARFIVTETALAGAVVAAAEGAARPLAVLEMDTERRVIERQDDCPIVPAVGPDSACYVMYTSGSTGTPKGIVLSHRGVVRLCVDTDYMDVRPEHCFAQVANIAFDAATWEIWGALLNGAQLALLAPETALATTALREALREQRVTHLFLTTALWNQHVANEPTIFAPLEYLLFGGEAASAAAVRQLLAARARPGRLIHVYGPTENTTYSTAYELTAPPVGDIVPIGKAIAGSSCHVVHDIDGRLVPVLPGERGELLVGGLGLAREYLNDEAATRAKFVECAFAPGERLYRTGDIVEVRSSGDLVFVGRTDNQVKLRGFRIELEEIELALATHPGIRGAVVLIEGAADHRRLVATLTPDPAAPLPTVRELRQFLAPRLPAFMIPAVFVQMAAFPIGVTGKIDRRRIADLARDPLTPRSTPHVTRSVTETRVRALWAGVLGIPVDALDHDRDVLELGADSLQAARVVTELRRSEGVALGVHDILRDRTIERLAARIDAVRAREGGVAAPTIPHILVDHGLPLSYAQEQVWLHQQSAAAAVIYNEPLDITIPEVLDIPTFARALDLMLERHEVLRTRVEIVAGVPTQRIAAHERRPLVVRDLRHLPPAEAEAEALRQAEAQARQPFDLAGEPLFRALLVRLADDRFRLHMVGHHLVLDGVTMFQIVLPELEAAYRDLAVGRAPSLPPIGLRFRDAVAWLRSPAAAGCWSGQEAYWQRQLAGAEPLVLPLDHARPAQPSHAGDRLCFALSSELRRALRELAARQGSTLFATLLAAFKALLFRHSKQRDLTVASVVSARTTEGLDRVAGNFLNTIMLRTEVPAAGSFLDLLAAVGRTCLGALEHSDLPFQHVARYAARDPSGTRQAPIQAAFVLEPPVTTSAGGWVLGQHAIHTATAKFDLTFELDERPDGIIARVEYRSELFDASTIARMIADYQHLLACLVADPGTRLSALTIDPGEPRRLPIHGQSVGVPPGPPGARRNHELVAPRTEAERTLWTIWRNVLGIDELSVTDDFFEVGGDSLASLTVVARATTAGLHLRMRDLLEHRSIDGIASRLAARVPECSPAAVVDELDGPCPALPIQRWFLARGLADLAHNLQAFVVQARERLDPARLEQALTEVTSRHPALRTRLVHDGDGVAALRVLPIADPTLAAAFAVVDATDLDAAEEERRLLAAAAALTARIDPTRGPVIAVALLDRGPGRASRLWVGIHHLVIDGVSWRVLLDEWSCVYRALAGATGAELLQPSWSPARWARALAAYADGEAQYELAYWQEQLAGPATPLPGASAPGTLATQQVISIQLTLAATADLLVRAPRAAGAPINTLFLVALHAALGRWLAADDLCVWMEGHGREAIADDVDLTRTIGWLTALFPLRLQLAHDRPLRERIAAVTRALERPGHHGLGYLALRTLATAPAIRAALAPSGTPLVSFNYLGRLDEGADDRLLTVIDAPVGPLSGRANARFAALDINCIALNGRLRIDVAFASEQLDAADVERFTASFVAELTELTRAVSEGDPDRVTTRDPGARRVEHRALVRLRAGSTAAATSATPLFLVHPAGGSAFGYRELVRHLGGDRPVHGLECVDGYAGKTLVTMAATYVEAVRSVQPEGPYLLGGWSLGGIIAAEMARQLEAAGETIARVILIDARPAQHPGQRRYLEHMLTDEAALLALLGRHLGLMVGTTLGIDYATLRELPDGAREPWLVARIAAHGSLAEVLHAGFVRRFVDDFLSAGRLIDGLQESRSIRAPMLLLRASNRSDHYAGFPALEEPLEAGDTTYGWGALTGGGCTVRLVAGTHEDLLFGAHARTLAEPISEALLPPARSP
jgi:amino acid adenylation domain-containing protein/non-ribosomal peptide synthase protein (TIGR01720 family)